MEKLVVNAVESGEIKEVLFKSFPQISRGKILTILRKKDVKVNGKKVSSGFVEKGSEITIFFSNSNPEVKVIFEDQNILIVFKPQVLEVTIKDKVYFKPCLEEIFAPFKAVHRLDMNTEGIVVFAKNQIAEKELLKAFKNKTIEKYYSCLVFGTPKENKKTLTDYLINENGTVKITTKENGQEAILEYEVVENYKICSLLKVHLLTGRTHQIRVQMANMGNALVGDDKYGNKQNNKKFNTHKQCLCASTIKFNFSKNSPLNYLNEKDFEVKPTFLSKLNSI